jgi:hypothetical protein
VSLRLTRRRFLVLSGVGAGAALGYLRGCRYDDASFAGHGALAQLSPRQGVILAAVVDTMLPPAAERAPAAIAGHVRAIDAYLTGLPAADVAQLGQCLTAIEQATLPFGGHLRRFSALDAGARADVLDAWQTSSVGLLRLGFRSLKALVFLAYYRDAAAWRPLGYAGPAMPGGGGSPEVRARYDALLAPAGTRPR